MKIHTKASARRRNNTIYGVEDSTGIWHTDDSMVENIVIDYFQNIFTSSGPSSVDIEPVIESVRVSVSNDMNEFLCSPYSKLEVKDALWQSHPSKSPGPDGFSSFFYRKYWEVIKKSFMPKCLVVLNGNVSAHDINKTHIVLIPRVKNPKSVSQFRPISLCNVIYKVITKIMANRLKTVLDKVVLPNQSAFVPGRLITNNVVVAFECLHKLKFVKSSNNCFAALKLDMTKAYDKVEWSFLRRIMEKMSFADKWVQLVINCVSPCLFR